MSEKIHHRVRCYYTHMQQPLSLSAENIMSGQQILPIAASVIVDRVLFMVKHHRLEMTPIENVVTSSDTQHPTRAW